MRVAGVPAGLPVVNLELPPGSACAFVKRIEDGEPVLRLCVLAIGQRSSTKHKGPSRGPIKPCSEQEAVCACCDGRGAAARQPCSAVLCSASA